MRTQRYHGNTSSVNDRDVTGSQSPVEAQIADCSGVLVNQREIGVRWSAERRDAEGIERSRVQDLLRQYTRINSVRRCGCTAIPQSGGTLSQVVLERLRYSDGRHGAAFRGMQTCGSPHACFECAWKIRDGKAGELAALVGAHLAVGGDSLGYALTFTHYHDEGLRAVLARFKRARRAFMAGGPWRKLAARWGVQGWVVCPDFTHGVNGWHVHGHGIVLLDRVLTAAEAEAFGREWFILWRAACERIGGGRPLAHFNQMSRVASGEAASRYMVKALREVTRSDTKHHDGAGDRAKGRSPWEIIRAFFATGDLSDLALWREYEAATKGTTAVSVSKTARSLMATYGVTEAREDELAAARLDGEVVDTLVISQGDLATMRAVPGRRGRLVVFMRSGGAVAALGALVHWRLQDEAREGPERRARPSRGRSPAPPS